MPEAFPELHAFLADRLPLTVGGVVYDVPAVDWETGLVCQALWATVLSAQTGGEVADRDKQLLDDQGEQDLILRVLGPVTEQLKAAKVGWPQMRHMGLTVFYWTVVGEDAARSYWSTGSLGNVPPRPESSTTTAGAATTRKRASGSGTSRSRRS